MAGMKLVDGIVKLPDQDIEVKKVGVKIDQHPFNADLLRMYVERGFGASYKTKVLRPKEKDYVSIQRNNLIRIPNDFNEGSTQISGDIKAICTVADKCQATLKRQIDTLDELLVDTGKEMDKKIEIIKNLENTIEELREKIRRTTPKSRGK